ncbi:unnamed protein product [Knipowitschia caucasica]
MADKEMIERLRQKRTAAQAAFTKKANNLTSRVNALEEGDLKAEWRNFKEDHNRVTDLGFEYSTALRELEDEEASVKANQIDERTHECDKKFDAVKLLVLNNLWTRFAKDQISDLVEEANLALGQAEVKDYQLLSRMERELINKDLEREVFEVNSLVTEWSDLIPHAELVESRGSCRKLRKRQMKLWDKWAWRRNSWSDEEEAKVNVDMAAQTMEPSASTSSVPAPDHKLSRPQDSHTPISGAQRNPTSAPTSVSEGALHAQGAHSIYPGPLSFKPQITLERARLPTFSGNMRDYYRWKAEWEDLQQLGNPHGLENVRKFHLLGSLDDRVKRDLVLSSCGSANDVFRLLDNKYGNRPKIALLISKEVHGLPPVKGNNPRKTIELIQAVERALRDLQVLGEEDAMKNRLVAQSIESKLPDSLKEKWLTHKNDPSSGFSPRHHFDCLLEYLKKQEDILEELDQLQPCSKDYERSQEKSKERKAFTKATSTQKDALSSSCIVCREEGHEGRLFACKAFKRLDLSSKKALLKKIGACLRCLRLHDEDSACTKRFLCSKQDCQKRGASDHNYLLCPLPPQTKKKELKNVEQSKVKVQMKGLGLTERQEEVLAKLSPELKAEVKEAFSNKITTTVCTRSESKPK